MKNLKTSLLVLGILVLGVSVFGVSVIGINRAFAVSSFWNDVEDKLVQVLKGEVEMPAYVPSSVSSVPSERLGAVETSPYNAANLLNNGTLTKWDSGYFWNALEVQQNFYVDGTTSTMGVTPSYTVATSTHGGLVTGEANGSFSNASTTLFCVQNPMGATSTLTFAELNISAATVTSSFSVSVVSTTQALGAGGGLSTSTASINPQEIQTSIIGGPTISANSTSTIIFSNLTETRLGMTSASTSVSQILVAPQEAICGLVHDGNSGSAKVAVGASSGLSGTFKLLFRR